MTSFSPTESTSLLLIIDIQERLLPAIEPSAASRLIEATQLLVQAANIFEVPVIVSEQYPRGLGPTVPAISELLKDTEPMAKTHFSAYGDPAIRNAVESLKRQHIIICGVEAHICVLQTALELQNQGYWVHVVADGIGSRKPENRDVAMELLRQSGAHITSSETTAFQWAQKAGTPQFKALAKLVR